MNDGRSHVTSVRVPSTWYTPEGARTETAHFKLGLGGCGKVVDHLAVRWEPSFVEVHQRCTDGETKVFAYPVHLLQGRVEVTYES